MDPIGGRLEREEWFVRLTTPEDLGLPRPGMVLDPERTAIVSPHDYYPHDHEWKFEGALESLMHAIGMFDRKDALELGGFEGSGADWLKRYEPYIAGENVIVTSPHKVYGPESNDLVLQLRQRGIDRILLGGMSANLCTESHMRELIEQGFQVTVVSDATAGVKTPAGDAHQVALSNYHDLASAVVPTAVAVPSLRRACAPKADPQARSRSQETR